MSVLRAAERLRDAVESSAVGSAPFVYNPLRYAWPAHRAYVERFGSGRRRAVLVGMNPGPWGMGQTGVPFGDVAMVRDWMGIGGEVGAPERLHPKRPVTGFATTRSEPSGSRLYGWAKARFGTADRFFSDFFVANHCPLLFFDDEGRNLTPPQLRKADARRIAEACDEHLGEVLEALRPEFVIGVGGYAEERARAVVAARGIDAVVGSVLHPSPASPAANRGWAEQAEAQLRKLGVVA